ncbi:hypothetical protein ACFLRF_01560 [Candidatus Altiarchaeota archaeon]
MEVGARYWNRTDWMNFILTYIICALHVIAIGFPIITGDSWRFISVGMGFPGKMFFLSNVSVLIGPLIRVLGAWAFPLFGTTCLAYALTALFKRLGSGLIVTAHTVLASQVALLVNEATMDVYMIIGAIALYLILNDGKDVIVHLLLYISMSAHLSNTPILAITWVLYLLAFGSRRRAISMFIVILILSQASILTVNYLVNKQFRVRSGVEYTFAAAKLMASSPEITRHYIRENPGSLLASHQGSYEMRIRRGFKEGQFIWGDGENRSLIDMMGGKQAFNRQAGSLLYFAFTRHPVMMAEYCRANTIGLLNSHKYNYFKHRIDDRDCDNSLRIISRYLPWQSEMAARSLQCDEHASRLIEDNLFIYGIFYFASLIVNAAYLAGIASDKGLRKRPFYRFVVFSAFIFIVNAIMMSNGSGVHNKLNIRVIILPVLTAALIVRDAVGRALEGDRLT